MKSIESFNKIAGFAILATICGVGGMAVISEIQCLGDQTLQELNCEVARDLADLNDQPLSKEDRQYCVCAAR